MAINFPRGERSWALKNLHLRIKVSTAGSTFHLHGPTNLSGSLCLQGPTNFFVNAVLQIEAYISSVHQQIFSRPSYFWIRSRTEPLQTTNLSLRTTLNAYSLTRTATSWPALVN